MLTELQREKLTRYFRVYDVDDDGVIRPRDFERVVENVRTLHGLRDGSPGHERLREGYLRQWEALRASADADDDGGVDLDEWLAYFAGVIADDERYGAEVESVTDGLFEIFDTDEDGVIGPDEFCDFYGVFGLSAALARRVFVALDDDADGAISRRELSGISHEFYRGDDPDAAANALFGPPE